MEPKKPLQKILNFKAHFAGTIDNTTEIPIVSKINVTKFNNANQNDLYHQVSQSQRAKVYFFLNVDIKNQTLRSANRSR